MTMYLPYSVQQICVLLLTMFISTKLPHTFHVYYYFWLGLVSGISCKKCGVLYRYLCWLTVHKYINYVIHKWRCMGWFKRAKNQWTQRIDWVLSEITAPQEFFLFHQQWPVACPWTYQVLVDRRLTNPYVFRNYMWKKKIQLCCEYGIKES